MRTPMPPACPDGRLSTREPLAYSAVPDLGTRAVPDPPAPSRRAERVAARSVLGLVLLLVVGVQAGIVTEGFRKTLLEPDGPSHYFDAYADSLLEGRLDVNPYHVGTETFVFEDRAYAYFGVTPALLRMPLHAAFPSLWGHWSRAALLLCGLLTVVAAHQLVRLARPGGTTSTSGWLLHGCFLLAVGLGSTSVFLPSRPNVFHESAGFGTALALFGYIALIHYLREASPGRALGVVLLCLATLHARPVPALGLGLAIGLVAAALAVGGVGSGRLTQRIARAFAIPRLERPRWHAAFLLLGLCASASSYLWLNHAKSGHWWMPLNHHVLYSPQRLAATSDRVFALSHLPQNAYHYFAPGAARLGSRPPFVHSILPSWPIEEGFRGDWREPTVSLTLASPVLLVLAGVGSLLLVCARLRPEGMPLASRVCVLGSLASACVPLFFWSITPRYAHDLLPFLTLAAAVAVAAAIAGPGARRRAWLALLLAGTAWSANVWISFAFDYQKWGHFIKIIPYRAPVMIPVYEQALARDPDQPLLLTQLGLLKLDRGDRKGGIADLERAVALDPDSDETLLYLAGAHQESDPGAAIRYLRRAVEANPGSVEAQHSLGLLLFRSGKHDQAIVHLRAAIELYPPRSDGRGMAERQLAAAQVAKHRLHRRRR